MLRSVGKSSFVPGQLSLLEFIPCQAVCTICWASIYLPFNAIRLAREHIFDLFAKNCIATSLISGTISNCLTHIHIIYVATFFLHEVPSITFGIR